ncbi:hypothetical protein H7142_00170 [Candidatus Saccharibacteria bacterium]|nr:hypothetical protein [Candidatus Saccharibacteria bacterium]
MKPRLIIEQKITAFVNKYKVLNVTEAGQAGELLALAQQKRLALKEKVTFYSNEQKASTSFSFRAEKVMDVHGRYIVEDANENVVGMFRKEFKKSLLVSSWVLMNADGTELFRVKESNETIAILRRFIGFIPLVGELLEIIMLFFRYHFSFIDLQTNTEVGQYKKITLLRDHYSLCVTDDAWKKLDWRVFAAMGVALDALQSR